ncbi:hypothetical protein SAMN04488128_10731 [Chitinophaga eiseniae]|uniref:Uncharacterized protein n=1 Tax=Chitinophaga eiseniae TaxID=634771 RepID=A0A1T4TYL4_9BACT|nr:hypothetical protein SAMN04488128_10731 [Chitinophaga eiseniae]
MLLQTPLETVLMFLLIIVVVVLSLVSFPKG